MFGVAAVKFVSGIANSHQKCQYYRGLLCIAITEFNINKIYR